MTQGFGMQVLGVDPYPQGDWTFVSADEALSRAHVVVCAMDLTPETRGFFDLSHWKQVQRGTLFVNISRGEISPSTVLLQALELGLLGGVALDVYAEERELAEPLRAGRTPTHPEALAALALAERPDVVCTPHNAFNTAEAVARKSEHSVLQVRDWLEQGAFRWPVAT